MSTNISISSGSNFRKKIFGTITKLTKPSFVHNGRVFSDNTVKNQKIIPLIENNIYYTNHGLPDEPIVYNFNYPIDINAILNNLSLPIIIQTVITNSANSIADKHAQALLNNIISPEAKTTYDCQLNPLVP